MGICTRHLPYSEQTPMNPLSIAAILFALAVGASVGFAGSHASCDAGGTTIIKRTDRLEPTP